MSNGNLQDLESLRQRLLGQPQEQLIGPDTAISPRSILHLVKPLSELGQPEEEEDKEGFWESFITTGIASAIEPLGMIGPIGDAVESLKEGERTGLGKIGAGLGWFVGFAIPAAPAFKIGHTVAKGLGLVRAARAGAALGARGNFVRGAVAGALLTAGEDIDEDGSRLKHTLENAALFGIGDAALFGAWRAISGAKIFEGFTSQAGNVLTEGLRDGAWSEVSGGLRGKALHAADLYLPDDIVATKGLDKAKKDLLLGIDRMGLDELVEGEVKIIPSLVAGEGDLRVILASIKDVAFEVVPSSIGPVRYSNVLVSKGAKLDRRIVMEYSNNLKKYGTGFLKGQEVMFDGKLREVTGPIQGSLTHIKGRSPGQAPVSIELKYATFYPMATWRKGPAGVRGASALFAKFVERYGQWSERPFEERYVDFIKNRKLDAGQQADLKEYFTRRIRALVPTMDDDGLALARAMDKVEGAAHPFNHPEGKFTRLAQSLEYIADKELVDGKMMTVLRDSDRGIVERFVDEDAALEFLRQRPRIKRAAVEGTNLNPLPDGIVAAEGSGVQVGNTAASLSASWLPVKLAALTVGSRALPRIAFVRMMEDWSIRKVGEAATPPIWASFERFRAGLDQARLAMLPWVDKGYVNKDGIRVKSIKQIFGKGWHGGKKGTTTTGERVFDLLERHDPFAVKAGDEIATRFNLTARDVQIAKDIRTYLDTMWDEILLPSELIDVSAKDFIQHYMPRMRDTAEKDLERVLRTQLGSKFSEKTIKFIHEMERTGNSVRYMKDPAQALLTYTRAAFKKIHMTEPLKDLQAVMRQLPDEAPMGLVKESMREMMDMAYGGTAQHIWIVRAVAKKTMDDMGIVLTKRDSDRYIQTIVSLNYGAFMGFRPALALRNLTQSLTVTLPLVGPKYLSHGIKYALTGKAAVKEALEMSAIRPGRVTEHFQDTLWWATQYNRVMSTEGKGLAKRVGIRTLRGAQELSQMSVGGEIKTRFGNIPVGLYSRADTFNRVVAYGAQKRRVLDKWVKYSKDRKKFNQESGLNFLGEAHTREFHRIRDSEGIIQAAKWAGTQMANETQWIYQLGAGPAALSHGIGRLFGMYGTWPSWYAQHLVRGFTRGSAIDKARFFGWTAVVHASFAGSATTLGINLARWSPLNSLGWAGGPFFDWFKDLTDVVGGAGELGPTAKRQMALAKFGLEDTSERAAPFIGHLDPREGRGLDFKRDPGEGALFNVGQRRMAEKVLGMFTPGYLQAKDMYRARQEEGETLGVPNASWRFMGFKPVGRGWPQGNARFNIR